ncbi:MAG: hypothetical protein FWD38_00010 [Oscillospiraceae bacterium]|nr:hypothetical protein [Oscillospiraceae bacterium]
MIQLQELAAGSKEEVSAIVTQIEDGTFTNRRPGAASGVVSGDIVLKRVVNI